MYWLGAQPSQPGKIACMLPRRVPVLSRPPVVLRAFRDSDAAWSSLSPPTR